MARASYQKGRVEQRHRRHGMVFVLRYRLRRGDRWVEKTEELKGCRSRKEAMRASDKRMREVNLQNNGTTAMSLAAFVAGPWSSYTENRYKPSTSHMYNWMIKRFLLPLLGDKDLAQIRPTDVTAFFEKVRSRNRPKLLVNIYGLVRLMFGIATEFELIEHSPVKPKLHRPKYERVEKPALSADEIQRIIECTEPEYQSLITCAALTALRIGELLALRWQDIDFERRDLTVNHNLWKQHLEKPKTACSKKALRLSQELIVVLKTHHGASRWQNPTDWVFARADGSPQNAEDLRRKVLYPAMERAGIKRVKGAHGFHSFRHSAGSLIHRLTGDLKLAQHLLRHSNIKTTADTYVHVDEAAAEAVTNLLSRAIMQENSGPIVAQSSELIQ